MTPIWATPAPEHPCPRCGRPTAGAFSEGGLRWAICEDCMAKDREAEGPVGPGQKGGKVSKDGDFKALYQFGKHTLAEVMAQAI